jgi:hypothetical protein
MQFSGHKEKVKFTQSSFSFDPCIVFSADAQKVERKTMLQQKITGSPVLNL